MKINEHLLKVSAGAIVLESPLELGSDVSLMIDGSVTKIEDHDNNDGSCNRYYIVKGIISSVVHETSVIGEQ